MASPPSRKLAVILHADVAGSTALVQRNESVAHERMQDAFRRFSATIESYGGIAHEIRGDALVAEFARASDATSASIAFQAANTNHNEEYPDEIRPVLRAGIAMGEVVVADNTITGEGIVLAQRLEQLAQPGGIVMQGAAYETIPKRLPFNYENLGEREFKGFDEPVRVYAVSLSPGAAAPEPELQASQKIAAKNLPDKPSVAVLPFNNRSGDPDQEYFSDGITEDIITELSHFRSLTVTARNSSFSFRGQSVNIIDIGQKLNVRYVLEGSIRKAGNRVRVTAQLIDTETGAHVWADRYDRELEDIFEVQDEVVRIISATLIGRVEHADHELAKRKPPSSLKAYDCVVLGLSFFYKWTPEDNQRARKLFERAITTDPEYAPAYAWLAEAHFREGLNAWSASHEDSFSLFYEYAAKAVALDDNDSRTHTSLGVAYLFRGEHDLARSHLERALALNPSDTRALVHLARCETLAGNPSKGVDRLTEALRFNPLANYQWYAGQIHYIAKRYEEAIEVLSSLSNPNALVHAFLAASHGQLGNAAEAAKSASLFISKAKVLVNTSGAPTPESWVEFVIARYPFKRPEDAEHLGTGLKKAGLS